MNNGNFNDYSEVKRTYTPKEAGHTGKRKPVKRFSRRRMRRKKPNTGAVLIICVFLIIFGLCIYFITSGKRDTLYDKKDGSDITKTDVSDSDSSVTTEEPLPYYTVTVNEEQMHSGDLILVNSYTEYTFPEAEESSIVSIAASKSDNCYVSGNSNRVGKRTIDAFNTLVDDFYEYNGFHYLQINSAYRSLEDQISIYDDYTEAYGIDYAKAYVANPGFSEHHTGLAMDINIVVDGITYYVESYDGAQWFRENAKNYGFILRYPDDKVERTGINYESWHYRYVGTPHSLIMSDMNFCLEEYEDYLKQYTYDEKLLGYDNSTGPVTLPCGDSYTDGVAIYYVPAEPGGETTEIKIPSAADDYSVSGNNIDGYIVTLG